MSQYPIEVSKTNIEQETKEDKDIFDGRYPGLALALLAGSYPLALIVFIVVVLVFSYFIAI